MVYLYVSCPNKDTEKKKSIKIQNKPSYYSARFFSELGSVVSSLFLSVIFLSLVN